MNNIKTMKTQKLYLMLLTIMIVNACSIEKKHASFGYHIEWRNNKFSEGNKPIAQITKPKVAVINETDLILETKANAVEPNQDLNTEIVSASNEKSKYNLINKTRNINSKQLSIIKKSYEFVNKKKPLPKQNKLEMPETLFLACVAFGSGLLFILITLLTFHSEYAILFALIAFLLLVLGIILILNYLLESIGKSIKKINKKKDNNQYDKLK